MSWGSALPRVQQHALAGALVRDDPGDGTSRTTATAFVGVLAQCAEKGAVLLAVDDVQWLDSASAQTLAFALRRLPSKVGVLLAHRVEPGWELPLELARALPEDRLLRIVSRPLSLAALHHLVKSRLGTSLPPPLLARLANASGGNPFYALENGPRARARRRSEARAAFAHPRNLWNWWSSGSSPYRRPHGSPRSPRPPPHSRLCLSLCRRFPRMPTSARLFSRQRRRGVGQFARYGSGAKLRTNYGPRRPNSAHLSGQPWTPVRRHSRSTTVKARSGDQGVASSNLASPTMKVLVGAGLPDAETSPRGRGYGTVSETFSGPTRESSPEDTGSGPSTALRLPQIGADLTRHSGDLGDPGVLGAGLGGHD
jgi:hypothetical protein